MVRVTILASGSKGNCTVVATSKTRIMLDAGLSCREIVKRMRFAQEDPEKLDAILITHEHQDHIQGLSVMARRWNVPVFATEATHAAWKRWMTPRRTMSFAAWLEARRQQQFSQLSDAPHPPEQDSHPAADSQGLPELTEASVELASVAAECEEEETRVPVAVASEGAEADKDTPLPQGDDPAYLPAVEYFRAGIPFEVGDIRVTPFTIPHDAVDPVGFVLEAEGMRIAVATDLGYMPPNVRMRLLGADLLVIEANHDVEMLRDGPYPWAVKQRVLSRVGHLSNDAVGEYLANGYDGGARFVVLAHISESNNLPELARLAAERALGEKMGLLANKVLVASQTVPLESIYL
ncbi:MAG TPA: MBL fold metallo-hydrolase [Acidobacteriaceae bacterium]|nr:MBL fold metallo-hydrolase [Acidobacteriaceae bacterium]